MLTRFGAATTWVWILSTLGVKSSLPPSVMPGNILHIEVTSPGHGTSTGTACTKWFEDQIFPAPWAVSWTEVWQPSLWADEGEWNGGDPA